MGVLQRRRWTALVGMLALAASRLIAVASEQTRPNARPDPPLFVSLSSPATELQEHHAARPLLLYVTISNPMAANLRNRNANAARARERLAKSGELAKMSAAARETFEKTLAAPPQPTAIVGTPADPVWSLITFEFVHESGDKLTVAGRPLAVTRGTPAAVHLDDSGGVWMPFGVDANALTGARPGKYEIRAVLRTIGRRDMWVGEAASDAMSIRLAAAPSDSLTMADERDYQEGRFYLLDNQFERAKSLGERLLGRTPDSIAGYELLGDAQFGLGQYEEAERAFTAGIDAFQKKVASVSTFLTSPDSDHPSYFLWRLREIRARRK